MFDLSCAAGRDHRDRHMLRDRPRQFQIIPVLRSIAIHACQKNFSRAKLLYFLRPFYRIQTDVDPSAVFIDVPSASIRTLFRVDRNHHTLTAEFCSRLRDQFRSVDRR